jgi:hypothetical protein
MEIGNRIKKEIESEIGEQLFKNLDLFIYIDPSPTTNVTTVVTKTFSEDSQEKSQLYGVCRIYQVSLKEDKDDEKVRVKLEKTMMIHRSLIPDWTSITDYSKKDKVGTSLRWTLKDVDVKSVDDDAKKKVNKMIIQPTIPTDCSRYIRQLLVARINQCARVKILPKTTDNNLSKVTFSPSKKWAFFECYADDRSSIFFYLLFKIDFSDKNISSFNEFSDNIPFPRFVDSLQIDTDKIFYRYMDWKEDSKEGEDTIIFTRNTSGLLLGKQQRFTTEKFHFTLQLEKIAGENLTIYLLPDIVRIVLDYLPKFSKLC